MESTISHLYFEYLFGYLHSIKKYVIKYFNDETIVLINVFFLGVP